jgi:hypothetical protein
MTHINREEAKTYVGEGWAGLIDKIYDQLTEEMIVCQVKEKIGSLRVYVQFASESVRDLINDVHRESYSICEICGAASIQATNKHRSTMTRCDLHQ